MDPWSSNLSKEQLELYEELMVNQPENLTMCQV